MSACTDEERICLVCAQPYQAKRVTQKYCSRRCTSHSRSSECMQRPNRDLMGRLLDHRAVSEVTGCWEYSGRLFHSGYGQFKVKGDAGWQNKPAHRVMFELVNGPIAEGLVVRHRCDNKKCFNPDHLELGTHEDNVRDAVDRGLVAKGSGVGTSKLTEAQVAQIKSDPRSYRKLAVVYGVSSTTIAFIKRGQTWQHVSPAPLEAVEDAARRERLGIWR